ncbi:FG-GAP-like repeat-containing protein [Knoellia sp. p5-6-4]|uniref:FG-GAP-like repeat-containing protein n=1 Tax=unclassified Knoellia TaxID=2618719 RepID=UPI0023DB6A83|nr:FG-GAP-like repeat-containing protein [Knoellia sp. p5-6-4]MDF2146462.1 FG-GAP-like repeat-containing protein [Knoellia sp. p5-6-4]
MTTPTHQSPVARRVAGALGLTLLCGSLPVSGAWSLKETPKPRPVKTAVTRVPLSVVKSEPPGAPPSSSGSSATARGTVAQKGAVLSAAPVDLPTDLAVVGATWAAGSPGDTPQARVRTAGTWGPWQDLEVDDDHGPDAGRPEGDAARGGSAPLVVTAAEQVEVRIVSSDGSLPQDARVEVIDPGASPADAPAASGPPASASAAAAKPTIYSRAQWGADESKRTGSPAYGQVQLGFVHHTVDTNNYTAAQVPGIIRGIYAYHVDGQGWSDIGYNFLVDRFGRTWEGRYGGMDRAVIGAQTANYNSWSTGVSVIGDYRDAAVPSAVTSAVSRVLAWKFSLAGIPATGKVYARDKYFERISGHRDGYPTSCPGAQLYAKLPSIRSTVASLVGRLPVATAKRDVTGDASSDLVSYPGTLTTATMTGTVSLLRGARPIPVAWGRRLGSGWNALSSITATPDLTGDGKPDVVGVESSGGLRVYLGDGHGGFLGRRTYGSGWEHAEILIAAGDRTGDGLNDLLAVFSNGELRLYPGKGTGYVTAARVIGTGWNAVNHPLSAGDLNSDGHPDLLAVTPSDGQLRMYAGSATGGVQSGVMWGSGWGGFTALAAAGDLDGDGRPDLVAREASGRMRTYYLGATGKVERWNVWGSGWTGMRDVSSSVDFDSDGRNDVLAVNPGVDSGTLTLYAGNGQRDFTRQAAPVAAPAGADLVRVVGDVNGDGWADLVSRLPAKDTLAFQPGQAGGTFGSPVTIGWGWKSFSMLEPVGDVTQDGVPDLLVRRTNGTVSLYPMRRDLTFSKPIDLDYGWGTVLSATGAGSFSGSDVNGDIIALRGDHAIVMWRGGGHGAALLDEYVIASAQSDVVRILGVDDVNGDGHRDILAAGRDGRLWLYAGNGKGGLQGSRQVVRGGQGGGMVLG